MKIAFISNLFPPHVVGGYELGCLKIAEEMQGLGHEVIVYTSLAVGKLVNWRNVSSISVKYIFEPVYAYEQEGSITGTKDWQSHRQQIFGGVVPSNCIALDRELLNFKPEVIWVFNCLGLGPVGIVETCLTHSSRVFLHLMDHLDGVIADHQNRSVFFARYSAIKARIRGIACSKKILEGNLKLGSFYEARVIYNGIDFDEIPVQQTPLRTDTVFRFLYFGQVEASKGLIETLLGFIDLQNARPNIDYELDIIGSGSKCFSNELNDIIAKHNLTDKVRLVGRLPRSKLIQSLTNYHSAIMLQSPLEPFSYANLEAIAAGIPLIVTNGGGISECLPDNYPLLVHNRSDRSAVVAAMVQAYDSYLAFKKLALDIRTIIQSHCDFRRVILPAYVDMINQHDVPGDKPSIHDTLSDYYTANLFAGLESN